MAARLDPKHDERTRSKIQTSQLINRLETHALSETEVMTASQIKAAEGLLKKTLPDLQAVTIDGKLTLDPVQQLLEMVNGTAKPVPRTD